MKSSAKIIENDNLKALYHYSRNVSYAWLSTKSTDKKRTDKQIPSQEAPHLSVFNKVDFQFLLKQTFKAVY